MERPTSYCPVIETFRGAQQKTQRHALSICDVDVEFYINRAGKNLPKRRKQILEKAKDELRGVFGRN